MPSLGADMEAAILMDWRVKPGDRVKRGDVIAAVETDKGYIEIEVFEDGIVDKLVAETGKKLPVGTVLATIRTEGVPPAPAAPVPAPPAAERRVRVSPLARRLAAELGVDVTSIEGSGPGGAIEQADVERAAAAPRKEPVAPVPAAPPQAETAETAEKFRAGMRRAIAAAMTRSNRDIPHYYLQSRIDMSRASNWLKAANETRPIKDRLLPVVLPLKAVALALREVPELNGYWLDDQPQPQASVHMGFAISLRQGGLVIPAIHDADHKSLDELMVALRDLIQRTRSGQLRSSDLADATITVTHLGDLGVETVFGVIYPPQVALVGLGRITEQPWAEGGMLGVRPVLMASLSGDHRATDGHRGAQFLENLNRHLQAPEKL